MRRSFANFVRWNLATVIASLVAGIFILYKGIVMFWRGEFSIPSRSVCFTGVFGRVLSGLFIAGGIYALYALYDLFRKYTKDDDQER